MARVVSSLSGGTHNDGGHAWRAAKILEIGRRMGGHRAMYDEAAGHVPTGSIRPYSDSQFMRPGDPDDMKEHLIVLRVFGFYMLQGADSPSFGVRTWELFTKAGVLEVLLDILASEGSLKEHVRVVEAVWTGMRHILMQERLLVDKTVIDAILDRTRSVWKPFWDSRHLLPPYSPTEYATDIDREHAEGYETITTSVLIHWNNLYFTRHSEFAPTDTYIAHASLTLWMCYQHPDLAHYAEFALNGLHGLFSKIRDSSEEFAQEAVIEGVGLEAYLERLDLHISRQRHPENMCTLDYKTWILCLPIMTASSVLPHLIAHGTLDSLINLHAELARNSNHVEKSTHVLYCVLRVFNEAFEAHWITRIERKDALPLVALRGEDLITIFSKGLHQVTRPDCKDREILIPLLREGLLRAEKVLQQLRPRSRRFKPQAHAFYEECLLSAPDHWYAAFSAVETANYHRVIEKEHCASLIHAWILLGKSLGLHRDKERERLERLKRIHCGWYRCEHHCVKTDGSLRKCAGCNDVRYCTRECQTADWKARHKNECGNRLKAQ
ncbi:unnamed protein product [Peniophora sp. CBMAI 1063]|nr:unnamed protein product [Peniophora sp. CBMAI 1063]